jgi:hypothetical protein
MKVAALPTGFFLEAVQQPEAFGNAVAAIEAVAGQYQVPVTKGPVVSGIYDMVGEEQLPQGFEIAFNVGQDQYAGGGRKYGGLRAELCFQGKGKIPFRMILELAARLKTGLLGMVQELRLRYGGAIPVNDGADQYGLVSIKDIWAVGKRN